MNFYGDVIKNAPVDKEGLDVLMQNESGIKIDSYDGNYGMGTI